MRAKELSDPLLDDCNSRLSEMLQLFEVAPDEQLVGSPMQVELLQTLAYRMYYLAGQFLYPHEVEF